MGKKGTFKIEQINSHGEVVEDFDNILSPRETKALVLKIFPETYEDLGNIFTIYKDRIFCIVIKNISYLGNPHPSFKKRIQIDNKTKNLVVTNLEKGIETRILGVYSYDNSPLFCDFNVDDYIVRKLNNSSAHIYTNDLQRARILGLTTKTDFNRNRITVFDSENIENFFKTLVGVYENTEIRTINIIDDFFSGLSKIWNGIDCYEEMRNDHFPDAFQAEWPGFYLEYLFDKFIPKKSKNAKYVEYRKFKKKSDIDLDLYFGMMNSFGDLKTHSRNSSGILGNDFSTIEKLINNNRIWYVVCEFDAIKDKDMNFKVTESWNQWLLKEDRHSYGGKMKNQVSLLKYYILEINKSNFKYVKEFHQGKNSNGLPRKSKTLIRKSEIGDFLIHSKDL